MTLELWPHEEQSRPYAPEESSKDDNVAQAHHRQRKKDKVERIVLGSRVSIAIRTKKTLPRCHRISFRGDSTATMLSRSATYQVEVGKLA